MIPVFAVLAGVLVGAGIAVLVRAASRPQPQLAAALDQINQAPVLDHDQEELSQDEKVGRWLLQRLQGVPGVTIRHKDLALLGKSPAVHMLTRVALALLGLIFPTLLNTIVMVTGNSLPLPVPLAAGLAVGGFFFVLADWEVRDKARRARAEFSHAIAAYLDLIALERAGDAGPSEAVERAAGVGQGWAFLRIRQALERARIDKVAPWVELKRMAEDLDVPQLADVADIMSLSSTEGAAVYNTLRARAKSLRSELMSKQAEEANADSEKMTAPGALLAVLVMVLIGFPAVMRILSS
ncbi:hypothetical protein KNE206_30300 [Kitasatospora sp. NE20-6]|uniref:hypothetical protein n=1 Tax=Kitasatospora sp. NE20-6 TaxID=2859066 RepID=UPI0034DC83FD